MKQIFDWLREEIEANSVTVGGADIIGSHMARVLVNQAEAKWEAEVKVCEWKQEKYLNFALSTCTTSCGKRYDISEDFNFCPYCGKKIKISEVE